MASRCPPARNHGVPARSPALLPPPQPPPPAPPSTAAPRPGIEVAPPLHTPPLPWLFPGQARRLSPGQTRRLSPGQTRRRARRRRPLRATDHPRLVPPPPVPEIELGCGGATQAGDASAGGRWGQPQARHRPRAPGPAPPGSVWIPARPGFLFGPARPGCVFAGQRAGEVRRYAASRRAGRGWRPGRTGRRAPPVPCRTCVYRGGRERPSLREGVTASRG
mmetsp:Transcript_36147/g.115178  ORF Transcript_36147/g.115178 Transcript_36147/m.115178 type:complete len:220 (+) Transcript_36147:512-1171(+)